MISIDQTVRPYVKRFALCYRTVVCLSILSCLYCGKTVGLIKMKLGTQVGLCPGHIVLDEDSASVRLSVTRRYCVKTTARSTVQFALSDSKMCLVL